MDLKQAIQISRSSNQCGENDFLSSLELLEKFECWAPFFRLVDLGLKFYPAHYASLQIRLASIHLRYFEDIHTAVKYCNSTVQASGMSFDQFKAEVISRVCEVDDFAAEGVIIQSLWEKFLKVEDRVLALERLGYIYEKKLHNETLLNEIFEKLLKIDPQNSKALRYFRTLYTQLQDWHQVTDILRKLLAGARHSQEIYRYAQELAAVLLYQLDDADQAVSVLEEYCVGSTLDTSTIHYEAYMRLGKLDGCLKVLRGCLVNVEESYKRAVIHFRMGNIFEQQNQLDLALENYQKTLEFYPEFLDVFEGILSVLSRQKRWPDVKLWLLKFKGSIRDEILSEQVQAGVQRLEQAIDSLTATR